MSRSRAGNCAPTLFDLIDLAFGQLASEACLSVPSVSLATRAPRHLKEPQETVAGVSSQSGQMLEIRIVHRKPTGLPDVSALSDRHLLQLIENKNMNT